MHGLGRWPIIRKLMDGSFNLNLGLLASYQQRMEIHPILHYKNGDCHQQSYVLMLGV
jgi:hypothetical protein